MDFVKWLKQSLLICGLLLVAVLLPDSAAQQNQQPGAAGADAAIRDHLRALEGAAFVTLDDLVSDFEENRFSDTFMRETTRQERRDLLAAVKRAVEQAGDIMLEERNDDIILRLAGGQTYEVQFRVMPEAPFAIAQLRVVEVDEDHPEQVLTRDNLEGDFQLIAGGKFSGVVHVRVGGEILLEKAYGQANAEFDIPIGLNTIFGIGSTPIDFTIASVYVLVQEGRVQFDDKIAKYFEDVPADKNDMTIRHLMGGQSGLPDFHDTEADWDPDLGWIDRATAERRILSMPLLFEPGRGSAHSHAAFVLLAAIIERVSGQDYYGFIKERFLDPAAMTRTGMYGDSKHFGVADFAVGGGPSFVGVPNIPPNWGPTSWLVMGSGGMYSTAGDLLRYYRFVRTSGVLEPEYAARRSGAGVSIGGSERGFYIFHAYIGVEDEALIVTNMDGRSQEARDLSRALERFIEDNYVASTGD